MYIENVYSLFVVMSWCISFIINYFRISSSRNLIYLNKFLGLVIRGGNTHVSLMLLPNVCVFFFFCVFVLLFWYYIPAELCDNVFVCECLIKFTFALALSHSQFGNYLEEDKDDLGQNKVVKEVYKLKFKTMLSLHLSNSYATAAFITLSLRNFINWA